MPYKGLFILIFLFAHSIIIGQNLPDIYAADTARINNEIKKSRRLIGAKPEKALLLADTILSLSQKHNYRNGIFAAFNIKGSVYLSSFDFDIALATFKQAMLYAGKNDDPRNRAIVLSNLGLVYRYQYMQDSALYYLQKTRNYTEENHLIDLNAKVIFDIAGLYLNQQKYSLAATYLFEAKEKAIIIKDSTLLMFVYNTFGVLYSQIDKFDLALYHLKKVIEFSDKGLLVDLRAGAYLNIGELYFKLKEDFDSAAYYYHLSKEYALPHEKGFYALLSQANFGNIFFAKKKYDSAEIYYQNVLKNDLIEKYSYSKAAVLVNLGTLYLESGEEELAQKYSTLGYDLCKDMDLLLFKKNALYNLYKLDSIKGNYLEALSHYQEFHKASDSLQSTYINTKIARIEFEKNLAAQKYDNEVLIQQNMIKSKQIISQKRQIWLSVLGFLILLSLLYSQYRNRIKLKKLHIELSAKHEALHSVNEELNTSNETLLEQQEQLKALNISKDKFLAILGHDLKSPFVSLLGMLNLMNEEWDEMEDREKHRTIERLYRSSLNNYHLLEDLLSWGKAQQGQIKAENSKFLVYPKMEQVIALFQDQINKKDLNIHIEIPDNLQLITDERIFIQIVQNLLNNAIKFTESGGAIRILLRTTKDEIQFCVEDSGIGIPEDKISDIFSLHANFNRPGTLREKSTGMGLILSKEFAQIIKAQLSATSIEGEGSVFCLSMEKSVLLGGG